MALAICRQAVYCRWQSAAPRRCYPCPAPHVMQMLLYLRAMKAAVASREALYNVNDELLLAEWKREICGKCKKTGSFTRPQCFAIHHFTDPRSFRGLLIPSPSGFGQRAFCCRNRCRACPGPRKPLHWDPVPVLPEDQAVDRRSAFPILFR